MVHVEPVEIVDDGVIFVELECDGKGNLSPIRGTENLYQADSTIIAISQGPKDRIVSTNITPSSTISTGSTCTTNSTPSIFA